MHMRMCLEILYVCIDVEGVQTDYEKHDASFVHFISSNFRARVHLLILFQ